MIFYPDDIKKIRPLSENINELKRIQPYIEETEKLHLIPAIGIDLYTAIKADKTQYSLLLNGGTYSFNDENKYFAGLKDAIGYLSYSRMLLNQNLNVTAFGVVSKTGQFSEQTDERALIRAAKDAEKIGLEYLTQCVNYCIDKKLISCNKKVNGTRKFKAIG